MPLTCNRDGCDRAVTLRDAEEQPDGPTVETYECSDGHAMDVVVANGK